MMRRGDGGEEKGRKGEREKRRQETGDAVDRSIAVRKETGEEAQETNCGMTGDTILPFSLSPLLPFSPSPLLPF
jgi:hypothetical protein